MFDPERAEIRFGCGLSPRIKPVESIPEMLSRLQGPDQAAQRFKIPRMSDIHQKALEFDKVRSVMYLSQSKAERDMVKKSFNDQKRVFRNASLEWFSQIVLRRVHGTDGLRERLTAFWADHFTTVGTDEITRTAYPIYIEEAIRPHVAGKFADMLREVTTHPLMLTYLNQDKSVGPNSTVAKKRKKKKRKKKGLNENLARELLELHTLGVDGPYSQQDVRQLAELLTGLHYSVQNGATFRPEFAEPGPETVLGKSYGNFGSSLADIHELLRDLAMHPVTAAHLSRKLAIHFISDIPDPALIDAMAARYLESESDLLAVYEVMLNHPSAWDFSKRNVKQPMDFVTSTFRALDASADHISFTKPSHILRFIRHPLTLMGQDWGNAPGPDGLPEKDDLWITPQRLAVRLQWAMTAPKNIRGTLPDPTKFVDVALGREAPEVVRFAASAAESRIEGVGLVLASPAFQRM